MQDSKRLIVIIGISAGIVLTSAVQAQVTLDGTLGRAASLPGPAYQITPELGQQVGGNLFYSFGQFSIQTGESATFSGPSSVNNIIGRVTGGRASFIDGTIRSSIPGASLYLLNPAGMLFGEHAVLDVNGAFYASTADTLRLGNDGHFDARNPANSVLTVAPVAAFGFLGTTPAPITLQGSILKVPEGQNLSLIGGDVHLSNATAYAPAGRLSLVSIGSPGEVIPTTAGFSLHGFGALGTFSLEHTSAQRPILHLGELLGDVALANLDASGAGGGTIFIRAGQWLSHGGWVFADTMGDHAGGGIDVAVTGAVRLDGKTGVTAATYEHSKGAAGSIRLSAGSLDLGKGSQISSSTFGAGPGGDLHVAVRGRVVMSGDSHFYAVAQPGSSGDAGSITLETDQLDLTGGSQLFSGTFSTGAGGNLHLSARDTVTIRGVDPTGRYASGLFTNAQAGASGAAGSMVIETDRLELHDGGLVSSTTWGPGNGGNISLYARDTVTLRGADPSGNYPSGLYTQVQPGAKGHAGSITVDVGRIQLSEGGLISSATLGRGNGGNIRLTARDTVAIDGISPTGLYPSSLFAGAQTGSTGHAGSITVNTGRLELHDGGLMASATLGAGRGGNITLNARDTVTIHGIGWNRRYASGLFASAEPGSTGEANASNISLTTPVLTLSQGGTVSTASVATSGGNITLNADHLRLFGGNISARVYGGADTEGGNIAIHSINLAALHGSRITAQAALGKGGNILVNAKAFLHDAAQTREVLNASSQVIGNDGTVQNNAPNIDLSGSLTTLPDRYLDGAAQLSHRCGVRDPDNRSRFTIQGRGGWPPDPDQPASTSTTDCFTTARSPASAAAAPVAGRPAPMVGFGDSY